MTHLTQVGATYYFRRVVPDDLRPFFLTKTGNPRTEFMVSLRTKDRAVAKERCNLQAVEHDQQIREARTTKSILLKSVRAAAEGPGAWVDHVRDSINNPWMDTEARKAEVIDRFDIVLTALTQQFETTGKLPDYTLVRTPVWWTAIGLITHDLYQEYDGGHFTEEKRETFLQRLAKIDWSLGNPEFGFLGASVADRDRKTGEFKSIPTDSEGRQVITRFHGGSKAYFNLAAFLRRKIGLYAAVPYGDDYGVSVHFDAEGKPIENTGDGAAMAGEGVVSQTPTEPQPA